MMYQLLIEPLTYDFMQRALMISVLVGFVCSLFSCFLVLKGWSLMGDAVSHAVLPGLALAYVIGLPLAIGAFVAGIFCAVGTGFIKQNSRIKEDTAMGILFSGLFAVGLVMLSKIETDLHLMHVLFGNVLGITRGDMIESAVIAIAVSVIILVKRRDFMLYCFDPAHATTIGLPVKILHFGLLSLLALTIVSALKAAGIILVVAMLIAPGAAAFLLTNSFDRMLWVAAAVSVLSCVAGTIISYHADVATAPLIVVIQTVIVIVAMIYNLTLSGHRTKHETP